MKRITLFEGLPKIAKEWHSERNVGLSPDLVGVSSHKLVWWKCLKNPQHEWEQRISKRIKSPGCRFCIADEKSLATNFPEIAKEWHPKLNGTLQPSDVAGRGRESVWWQCQRNIAHVWQARVHTRTGARLTGCPFCAGKQVDDSNSLLSLRPDLIKEWHPTKNVTLRPEGVTCGSRKAVWWQCQRNKKHEWETAVTTRARAGHGCPFCACKYVSDDNRLSVQAPQVAAEWHPTKNRIIYADSSLGSYFTTLNKFLAPADRARLNKRRLKASDVPVFGKEIVWWQCKAKGHEWRARISSRSMAGQGCPYCSGRRVIADETSLAARFPAVAKQWHSVRNKPLTPADVPPMTNLSAWWRCHRKANHVWKSEIGHVVNAFGRGQTGCPFCAGRRISTDNNLAAKYPTRVKQMWHPTRNVLIKSTEVTTGSAKVAWWQCPKSSAHLWRSPICQITKAWKAGNSGCPFCSGKRFAAGESLLAKHPDLAKYWDRSRNMPLKPSKVSDRGNRRVWWRCPKFHSWEAFLGHTVQRWEQGLTICPQCRSEA